MCSSDLKQYLKFPVVIKPINEGSSVGVYICNKNNFLQNIKKLKYEKEILIEKYIPGREIQVAIMGNKKLGTIELVLQKKFYDYKAKYDKNAKTKHILPISLPSSKIKEVDITDLEVKINIEDSILRKIVEVEDRFNIIEKEDALIAPNLISPASGIISEGFDFSEGHYGVDIVLKERTPIKAVYDGIVLFAEWTLNYGFTVVVFQYPATGHKNVELANFWRTAAGWLIIL